jgi:hypothetical protein
MYGSDSLVSGFTHRVESSRRAAKAIIVLVGLDFFRFFWLGATVFFAYTAS